MEERLQTSTLTENIRITDAEAAAMVQLHARLNSQRESAASVRDVAEVLHISESEALDLFNQVRTQPVSQLPPEARSKERTQPNDKMRWTVASVITAVLLWFSFIYAANHRQISISDQAATPLPVAGSPVPVHAPEAVTTVSSR